MIIKTTPQTHQPRIQDYKLEGTRNFTGMNRKKSAGKPVTLRSYSDADFAVDKANYKSLNRGIILLKGMAVRWETKKQGGLSLFTMEANFVAASV